MYIYFWSGYLLLNFINTILTFSITALKEITMKVNVANYLIGDMSRRYPIKNRTPVDNEIIDVMVDRWSKKQFSDTPEINVMFTNTNSNENKYLM